MRSIVDDDAAAETLDQLQAASDRAYAVAKSAAMWSGREATWRDMRSIVLNEPVSPPPADISQLTLDAWSAVERARDAALMLVCPGR